MSLVGTRPPTEDEWVKYELHHRSRLAIKPGITGMWQVSGRSEITDFEQVVALDRSYIANWSLELDVKILCKTVGVVLRHEGAMGAVIGKGDGIYGKVWEILCCKYACRVL